MSNLEFVGQLKKVCNTGRVLTGDRKTAPYRKGFRSGEGDAIAVVKPASLLEFWQVLEICVKADKIILVQAANTGLTEGSTPKGTYDRDCVIISTLLLDSIYPLNSGEQVLACAGASLYSLEKLLKPLNRQPHSVIGSSCIGASVIGGVCNNSGGSLVERGPSYTELALYAQITEDGGLELVNNLGIDLGNDPVEILQRIEKGDFSPAHIQDTDKKASDTDYGDRVRQINEASPARYNANPERLYEASGCAGKLAVFAVRLDTFPENEEEQVFYIGTNDTSCLTDVRRHILSEFNSLPVSAEYMHREIFDVSRFYGKDTLLAIHYLGTSFLPVMLSLKGRFDALISKVPFLPDNLSDRLMQTVARVWPEMLPSRMLEYRGRYEHHLILKMSNQGIQEARDFLSDMTSTHELSFFECNGEEAKLAMLHRFAAAGAAVRYQQIHKNDVEDILALDIALRRDDRNWYEYLPDEINQQLVHKLYYGHFMCHVLHQDYIVKKGCDTATLKQTMLKLLDDRGAEYPAEHNVGHLYQAKDELADFYRTLDPTNSMNPGIGKTSKRKNHA